MKRFWSTKNETEGWVLKMSFVDLKVRFLTSSISVLLFAFLVYFANYTPLQWVITAVVATLGVMALKEYVHLLEVKGIKIPFYLISSLGVIYIVANYLSTQYESFVIVVNAVVALFFFAVFLYNFYQVEGAIVKIATSFFGALYIVVPLGLLLKILYPHLMNSHLTDGRLWLTYLIAVTKITDVGGYFAGKLWGRSKLAPHLSPGKTLIGSIAGFFSALIMSFVFFLLSEMLDLKIFRLSLFESILLGSLLGLFGQLGDLAESLLKRDAKVKDSNSIPGVGGMLDFLDSLLFTIPILYLFLRVMGG
jgi:phosphatidate cytidylyltransferase